MTNSEWVYHTPKFSGDAPEGANPDAVAQLDWKVAPDGWTTTKVRECRWDPAFVYRFKPNDPKRTVHLTEDAKARTELPIFDGFLAYFPNAVAEVARLSFLATQQHHPDQPMHWDRSKSTDHLNKIGRHMIDAGKLDDKNLRHSAMLAWRAMANLQEELERDLGLPPSPASRNRPY